MKFRYLIIFFLLFSFQSVAQRSLKYEAVAKKAETMNAVNALELYQQFLIQNPTSDRANLYYKIGMLSSEIFRDINPISDFESFNNFAMLSFRNLEMCSNILNESEIKRDADLFDQVTISGKRISIDDVRNHISSVIDKNKQIQKNSQEAHQSYVSLISSYIECYKNYEIICKTNKDENIILTDWDKNEALLNNIVKKYDQFKVYRNDYKESLLKLNNTFFAGFIEKKILTFKIDGFSEVDFTMDKGELWDYGTWAAEKINFYNENIKVAAENANSLLISLKEIQNEILQHMKAVERYNNISNDLSYYNPQSLEYRDIKIKQAEIEFLNYYYGTYQTGDSTDCANMLFVLAKLHDNVTKLSDSNSTINELFNNAVQKLNSLSVRSINRFRTNLSINFKKQEVPIYPTFGFYRAKNEGFVTKNVAQVNDGCIITGSYSNAQGFGNAFIAKSSDLTNIDWLKYFDANKLYDDCAMAVSLDQDGYRVLVSSVNTSDPTLFIQSIVHYDGKGVEKGQITLPERTLPLGRYIHYDPINENTTLMFYANKKEDWYDNTLLIIQKINKNNELIFKTNFYLNGEIIDVFHMEDNCLLLFGNYSSLKINDKEYNQEKNSSGIFSVFIDSSGKINSYNIYDLPESAYATKIYRTLDNNFTISGQKSPIKISTLSPIEEKEALYILTNKIGKQNKLFINQ